MSVEVIPIFPLSSVVLFPGVSTPLHIFEPRYRQMLRDALAGQRRIGMVTVPPEYADEMAGNPPVFPVGCAGDVTESEELDDGRSDLVLHGSERFRILEELPPEGERLYRVARIEHIEDPFPTADLASVEELRVRVVSLVREFATRADPERTRSLGDDWFSGVDDATLVNALCCAFAFECPEKQGLLEADGVRARFERLEGLLSFRLAELSSPGAGGAGRVH